MSEQWDGAFDREAYRAARRILELDRERAAGEIKSVQTKRARIVVVVAVLWAICSVVLALVNPELLLVAEIGWIVIVVLAVFFLLPVFMGRANLDELFDAHEERLSKLEDAEVPLPTPSSMEDLVAALDLAKLPGE